jgi:hypothetical protein
MINSRKLKEIRFAGHTKKTRKRYKLLVEHFIHAGTVRERAALQGAR